MGHTGILLHSSNTWESFHEMLEPCRLRSKNGTYIPRLERYIFGNSPRISRCSWLFQSGFSRNLYLKARSLLYRAECSQQVLFNAKQLIIFTRSRSTNMGLIREAIKSLGGKSREDEASKF